MQHDQIVKDLEQRLKQGKPASLVKSCLIYPYGESDVICIEGNLISQYEVKTTDHSKARDKANKQLKRGEDYWSNHGENFVESYYVVGRGEWFYEVNRVIAFDPISFFKKNRYYLRGHEDGR